MKSLSLWEYALNPEVDNLAEGVILYGAGVNAVRFIVYCERERPDIDILCIADADITKQGGDLLGIPIVAPEGLAKYGVHTCIIVTPTKYCIAISEKLNMLGFNRILYYNSWCSYVMGSIRKKSEDILCMRKELDEILEDNAEKIAFVRESLKHDAKSLEVFNAKLDSTFWGRHIALEALHEDNQYFPRDIITVSEREVFVDCGAYDGGTTLDFFRRGGHFSYVFEPDPLQYVVTKMTLEFEKIANYEIYNLGVSDHEGELRFSSKDVGASRIAEDGDMVIEVTSLDALLLDKPIRPTFIKMDIEGAEMEGLEGARQIIARDHPKLAISAYHGRVHLWEIPYWIKTNFPEYQMYMRQHSNNTETVCYALK